MTQIAVINRSSLDDAILQFACDAADLQMRRDFAPHWLGIVPPPVRFYASTDGLPLKDADGKSSAVVECSIVDAMEEGILGYHTDEWGVQYLRVGARGYDTMQTLSHEIPEYAGDPSANAWAPLPEGLYPDWTHIAMEVSDPCQGDTYEIEIDIFGRRESMKASDFVLPSYFDPNGKRPFTFLDTIDQPFGLSRNGGGYRILGNKDTGKTQAFWAQRADGHDHAAAAVVERKLANKHTRLARRMASPPGAR